MGGRKRQRGAGFIDIKGANEMCGKGNLMKNTVLITCTAFLFLAGCNSSGQQSEGKYQGRPETKTLEAASAAGYDGKAIRKNVDNTLNKNDEHNEAIDKTFKNTNEDQPKE